MVTTGMVPWDEEFSDPGFFAPPDSFGVAGPADAMFTGMPVLMGLVLAVALVLVVYRLLRGAQDFAENAAQPERETSARVVGRRTQTEGGGEHPVRTTYFATFEQPDGQRLEMRVPVRQYGQLAEGDQGRLTHQGSWFRGFERTRVIAADEPWEAPGGPTLTPPPPPH